MQFLWLNHYIIWNIQNDGLKTENTFFWDIEIQTKMWIPVGLSNTWPKKTIICEALLEIRAYNNSSVVIIKLLQKSFNLIQEIKDSEVMLLKLGLLMLPVAQWVWVMEEMKEIDFKRTQHVSSCLRIVHFFFLSMWVSVGFNPFPSWWRFRQLYVCLWQQWLSCTEDTVSHQPHSGYTALQHWLVTVDVQGQETQKHSFFLCRCYRKY